MPTFNVTVQFSGTKTYEIDAKDEAAVHALFDSLSSFDSYDNPTDDRVSENIIEITTKLEPNAR